MPTLLTQAPEIPAPQMPPRKRWTRTPLPQAPRRNRWTREKCAAMDAAGFFQQERLELVDGELIRETSKNRSHTRALMKFVFLLARAFGERLVKDVTPIGVSPEDNRRCLAGVVRDAA